MTLMNKLFASSAAVALAVLTACGGGGGSSTPAPTPTATTLAYADPTTGSYQLKKNTSLSTGTHLVLDLVGPAGTSGTGVSATFSADATKVTWTNVAAADAAGTYLQNGTAFTLGTAPQIFKAKVAGNVLQATVAQKGTANPVALSAPLFRVAVDLKAGLGLTIGSTIALSADAAKCQVLDSTGAIVPVTVTVGTLTAAQ
jgi:hypothetical protein